MKSQSDGGVDDATQSASEEGEDNVGAQPKTGSLLGTQNELLDLARSEGHIIGDPVRSEPESKDEEEETEEETESEEQVEEETSSEESEEAEGEEETKEEVAPKEHASIEDQIKQLETEGKKVPWYLPRIAKETRLKNERTLERDKAAQAATQWRDRAVSLETQLAESSSVKSGGDPLAGVFSFQSLNMKKAEAEHYSAWAERNRGGGECPIFGKKDKDGNPVTQELDEEGVTNLKLGCEKVLRDGIPNRGQYLEQYEEYNSQAVEIYPELKDGNSAFYKEAAGLMAALRQGFIPPDVWIWIGHAIKAKNEYLASHNGSGKADATKKIVKSAKTKVAPTATKTRGFVPRVARADLDKADKTLKEKGDADSAERWLEAKGIGGGARSKRVELVEK